MILLDWYKQFLQIRADHKEQLLGLEQAYIKPCESCENLKIQLEAANTRERMLIESIVQKDRPIVEKEIVMPQPIMPRHIPFSVKKQHLEAESKQSAAILKKKLDEMNKEGIHITAPSDGKISTEELEKELDLVEEQREAEHGSRS